MITNNAASRLLRGSHNIDLMNDEIRRVIKILICAVKQTSPSNGESKFRSEACDWTVRSGREGRKIEIHCKVRNGRSEHVISNLEKGQQPKSELVQLVHAGLPILAQGLINSSSMIKHNLSHIIDASEVII